MPTKKKSKTSENKKEVVKKNQSADTGTTNADGKKEKKEKKEVYFSKISPLDVAMSIRHLALMLKSGMPLTDGLEVVVEQATDQRIRWAYKDILKKVQAGRAMADAMEDHPKIFTHVVRSVVSVGEAGGTLEKNLLFLADFLKQSYELDRKVKGAMVYPMIVFGLTFIEMVGVIFYILPKLDMLFSTFDNIPAFTRFLMNASHFIKDNVVLMVLGSISLFIIQKIFFKTKIGIRTKEKLSLTFPIVKNLNKKHILTSFSRTLGILLESGIPIVRSIEIAADTVGNSFYEEALRQVHDDVREGNTLSESLAKHPTYFTPTYIKMVGVGEETGTLEENLLYLHDFYAEEVSEMSTNLTTLLEPILLIFIGAMIALLALSIISPIYQLTGSINQ